MKSLLAQSVFLMWIAVPAITARGPGARRGLRRTLAVVFLTNALYLAYMTLVHVRLYVPSR